MPLTSRERYEDDLEANYKGLQGKQADIWTAVPVRVKKYDKEKHTIEAEPTLKQQRVKPDGSTEWVTIPNLLDAPVHFSGGGGATITHPMNEGDECLAVFSSRCIDKWHKEGGVQETPDSRMHDLSDALIIPGFRSQKRKLENVNPDTLQIRSEDGKTFIELNPKSGEVTIVSAKPILFKGDLHVTGKIIAGFGGGNSVSVQDHVHTNTQPGSGLSGKPRPGT